VHAVIARLIDEHRNLERLVRLLDRQPTLIADPEAPNIDLMVDAIYYLTRFPDVSHHAMEDRIAARLLVVGGFDAGLGHEIERQHATLAQQGHDLLRDLESAARAEAMPRELVPTGLRLYAERLRHNMAVEELTLFPIADARLGPDDWVAIGERPLADVADPLFRPTPEQRFAELRRVIEQEAGDS
jgi:hemerythrin-like domain-containing protein